MIHCVRCDQIVAARRTAGDVAVEGGAAGHNTPFVRVAASDFAQVGQCTQSALLTGGQTVAVVVMAALVRKVVSPGRVAPTYRAFLEMALQDVTTREGFFAQMARVWSGTCVYFRSIC